MAQIGLDDIKRVEKNRPTIHDKVHSTYSTFDVDGSHYVQIDMLGRVGREMPGKLSQSIQLDKEAASFLVDLLKREFDLP
ncbi:methionyl-tRNA formyltransferase [Gemmiger sp.]